MHIKRNRAIALLVAGLVLSGCGANRGTGRIVAPKPAAGGDGSLIQVPFDPASFVADVDNPFFPLTRGTILAYFDGTETERMEVTRDKKTILGVAVTVVRDRVTANGSLTEDTFDWYAQDRAGNVWYFGEDTKEFVDNVLVSTEGSWEAGVGGAKPGIIMLARSEIGDAYAQEEAPGVAQDQAKVIDLAATVTVPAGTFTNCLETVETSRLEPNAHEYKFYARGVGTVLEITPKGGRGRVELTAISGR